MPGADADCIKFDIPRGYRMMRPIRPIGEDVFAKAASEVFPGIHIYHETVRTLTGVDTVPVAYLDNGTSVVIAGYVGSVQMHIRRPRGEVKREECRIAVYPEYVEKHFREYRDMGYKATTRERMEEILMLPKRTPEERILRGY